MSQRGERARPLLIVVCGPSGAGKSTLCSRLRADRPDLAYSVSCTTRSPRGAEVNGRDYHFVSPEEFEARAARLDLLEYAVVHGHRYGTPKDAVRSALEAGRSMLMDIDVQGARQIRGAVSTAEDGDSLKGSLLDIFVAPPSMEALRSRLVRRAEDAKDVVDRRLRNAEMEMAAAQEFRYVIVNDVLDRAYAEMTDIIDRESERRPAP